MFSGKTKELIGRLKRAKIANLNVKIFKPAKETRYDTQNIVSHDEKAILSSPVDNAQTILQMAVNPDLVGIREAQFVDDQLPKVCELLAKHGVRVIAAGLDMDYQGRLYHQVACHLHKRWKY